MYGGAFVHAYFFLPEPFFCITKKLYGYNIVCNTRLSIPKLLFYLFFLFSLYLNFFFGLVCFLRASWLCVLFFFRILLFRLLVGL